MRWSTSRNRAAAVCLLVSAFACQQTSETAKREAEADRRCEQLRIAASRQGAATSSPPQEEAIRVTYEYANWSLPLLVAIEAGLFGKHGVAISTRKWEGSSTWNLSDLEIVTGHGMYLMKEAGASPDVLRFVHPFATRKDGDMVKGLLVKKSAGIQTLKDLSPKQTWIGGFEHVWIMKKALEAEGVKVPGGELAGFTIKVGSWGKEFSQDSAAAAFFGWATDVRAIQELDPGAYTLLAKNLESTYVADPYFVGCSYVTVRALREKPQAVRRYVAAIDEAIDLCRLCPKAALGLVPKYFEFKPEEAARLGAYYFYKSSEPLELEALGKSQDADLAAFMLRGTEGLQ